MSDDFLWGQFCRLGEMIGDGLADEPDGAWIRKEYKQTAIALGVAKPSDFRKPRTNNNEKINVFMAERLKTAFINGYTRGQKQTETKCCALCKYWNYDGIQKYCFFERENLRKKERFDTCKNFKDARKENELKRK